MSTPRNRARGARFRGDPGNATGASTRRTSEISLDAGLGVVNHDQTAHLNRSNEMQLMHEDLARAHTQYRLEEAVRRERRYRLVAAHRANRRAEQAAARARRLLALAAV